MTWLKDYFKKNDIIQAFEQGKENFAHLSVIQEALLATGSVYNNASKVVIVKDNDQQASELVQTFQLLDPTLRIAYYNHEESLRVEAITESEFMKASRIDALYRILTGNFDICVTHAIASVKKLSSPNTLSKHIYNLSVGQEIEPNELARILERMGYVRVKYVEKPFTYSMRGGVCDIYSIQMERPIRIEFFDIEIDSIRVFDIETQRSLENIESATVVFATDIVLDERTIEEITTGLSEDIKKTRDVELIDALEQKRELVRMGHYDVSYYPLLAYCSQTYTFYDYVKSYLVRLSPYENIVTVLDQNDIDTNDYLNELQQMNEMVYIEGVYANFVDAIQANQCVKVHEFQVQDEIVVPWHQANIVSTHLDETMTWLKKEAITDRVIVSLNQDQAERFMNELIMRDIDYILLNESPKKPGIYIWISTCEIGFELDDIHTHVYTEKELFQFKKQVFRYDNKFLKAETLNQLSDLDNFDYVVHRQHGIGKYMGITTKEIDGIHKDFMQIMYKDGDELFVPLEQFNLVRKYLSKEATAVRLSKLGSSTWQKNKDRIKKDVADVADKLVTLYSQRMEAEGYAFSEDTEYQLEFEQQFEYELTEDQDRAIKEVKKDMEKPIPMDRLLCGDVGFGKTEVAIRAAFKAFVDHKQVVFLCPTTILSQQHYRTLKQRLKDYPVTIEVLNRFVSDKEQKEIIHRIREGKVDIVVGTHRVLSRDIQFYDLGLLIIDEEQRFGVEHKERIKEFKVSVDVLSLSATPIPRTLQMSLIGLRSLSQLNTPPSNRLPVMTYVVEHNKKTIDDIITKELRRNGQVFYLFNNVDQIYGVANTISNSIEGANVAIVHGKMDRHEIEDVMIRFINKEINVLVCTTIIETGIDIPNANTIIVENAHRFGLSQLYQIKGRVGRSDRLAYAYFVVPKKRGLTEIAQKRLQAIKEFTQLGSGYKIAMRDLTIRGAGELLGGNQSGFIDTVGIDLYVELLKEAIAERKGQSLVQEEDNPKMNLKIDGYLPEAFTSGDDEKLELYQQINQVQTFNELKHLSAMMNDRYGKLPEAVAMLLEKTRLELFLSDERIQSFKERTNSIELIFTETYSNTVDGVFLFELISNKSSEIKIKYVNRRIVITMPLYQEWAQDLIDILENLKEKDNETR